MIVPVEEGLDAVSAQEHRVLSHCLGVVVLPFAVCVLGIEIVLLGRHEGALHFLFQKRFPIEVLEPDMLHYIRRPVQPQPIYRLALDQPVNEVGRL